jgi:hypothetical protein
MVPFDTQRRSGWAGLEPARRAFPTAALSLALIAAGAYGLLLWTPASATLLATPGLDQPGEDGDSDGVPTAVESQFSSSPSSEDTDSDGYPDLVEILLGTDTKSEVSFPSDSKLTSPAAKALGYIEGNNFHILVALFLPDGDIASLVEHGAVLYANNVQGQGSMALDLNSLIGSGVVSMKTYPSGSAVLTSDSWFPEEFLDSFTFNSAGAGPNFYEFTVAFSAGFSTGLSSTVVGDVSLFASMTEDRNTLAYLPVTAGGSGAFRPLAPPNLPSQWQVNSACFVTTSTVGSSGATVTLQTTTADCEDFDGTFCDMQSCQGQVGRIYTTIDPLALGGGGGGG